MLNAAWIWRNAMHKISRSLKAPAQRRRTAAQNVTLPPAEVLEARVLLAADFTLQLLHASDLEGGVDAIADAPNFAAVVQGLEDDAAGMGIPSILVSAGDNLIPGPFFNAAGDPALRGPLQAAYQELFGEPGLTNIREGAGRVDVSIMNIIGFDASALGNHEFDAGTGVLREIIGTDIRGGTLNDIRWLGAQFPYLSANLEFSGDAALASIATDSILPNTDFLADLADIPGTQSAPKIAPATIITAGGEPMGVVGATTQLLSTISSPGSVEVIGPDAIDMEELADILQPVIDDLEAAGINKIVLVSHLQQIALEQELAELLHGVDIIIAGGSDTRLAEPSDRLRTGDAAQGPYPIQTVNADGDPTLIVSTDGQYSYVGRLVVEFDAAGVIMGAVGGISGAYATDEQGVEDLWGNLIDPFAPGTKGAQVRQLTDAAAGVVTVKDAQIFGRTSVFLEGRRTEVRTQETNLGNLTADANLAIARALDPAVQVSIKNGGGIRAEIGAIDGLTGEELPTEANPAAGKNAGEISQLDIENSLRFNNLLSLVSVSAAELKGLIEHGVAETAPGATPGRFPQIGGMAFSFDPARPAGDRVRSLAVVDDYGNVVDVIVAEGEVVGDADREIRIVTLNFLASGGDGYPFPVFGSVRVDTAIGEQQALGEYLASVYDISPFAHPDTPIHLDTRIQNLWARSDTVLTPEPFRLTAIGTYATGVFDESGAEIVAYDPESRRAFFTNASANTVGVLDITDPTNPRLVHTIDLSPYGGGVNSVAIANGLVAVAVEANLKTDPGSVVFFDTSGGFLNQVQVGALPDSLTFTPDGTKVLVANEGEPDAIEDPTPAIDPRGSISIIDLSGGVATAAVTTLDFTAFDGREADLRADGVRIFPGRSASVDLEPEYIAVSPDGGTAFVTLQEANAFAVIDIASAAITGILPLGFKDHSLPANGIDASDRDGEINIQNWPVFGMYMPDAIASFEVGGQTFYVTANEGDSRDFDESRVKDLVLDPTAFPDAATLQEDENLGRLTVSNIDGDLDGDGDYDQLFAYGARSFSTWDVHGNLVFDSGDDFEQITASVFPAFFNSNHTEHAFDNRSDNKGPEPEGVTTGVINGRTYAFVGLERIGGIMVYDITDPANAEFVQYVNNRNFTGDPEAGTAGDLGVEDLKFIAPEDSPNGKALLIASNEVSGTVTIFQFDDPRPVVETARRADKLTVRRNGDNIQVVNDRNGQTLIDQPLSATDSLTILGRDRQRDDVTVDFAFGGVFFLPGGIRFDAGSGQDTFTVIGTDDRDLVDVSGRTVAANGLWTRLAGVEEVGVWSGPDDDVLGVTSDALFLEGLLDAPGTPLAFEHVRFAGGSGDDTYVISAAGADVTIDERGGTDTLDFSEATAGVDVDLSRSRGQRQDIGAGIQLRLDGVIENIIGTDFDDRLSGNSADNILLGRGGDDWLYGGLFGDDVLVRGDGNDVLIAGLFGRNVLIGGRGSDLLLGGLGEDLLIGGFTSFDDDLEALNAIRDEWSSHRRYVDRVSNLENGGGANGSVRLRRGETVFDDGKADLAFGSLGRDWFLFDAGDFTPDKRSNELSPV